MMAASSAGTNGAATRSSAATSPVVNDPATTQPMCPLGPGAEGGDGPDLSSGVAVGTGSGGVVVTMDSIAAMASREYSHLHLWHVPSFRR